MSVARAGGLPTGWIGGLGCGALIMVNPATAIFLAALLAPSLLMRLSDDRPERAGARAVLLCNVAAVIGPFCRLWQEMPPTMARAMDMLSSLTTVSEAWLAAGVGWLVSEGLVLAAGRVLSSRDTRAHARLTAEIDALTIEWGEPPAGKAPL